MSSPSSTPTASATDDPAKSSSSTQQEQQAPTGTSTSTIDPTNAPPASLYVGDLDPSVTEADLYEFFNAVGPVASIRVCRDAVTRRSLGYAYVNYHHAADGETALNVLNYTAIKGHVCRLMWSQRDPSLRKTGNGNIFIKNLDAAIDNKALHDTFSAFGNILSCKIATDDNGKSKGYGFVHYETDEAAQNAIKHVDGMLLNDKKVFVGYHVAKKDRLAQMDVFRSKFTNVYVKNLDADISDEKLHEMFSKYGPVSSAMVSRDDDGASRGFGFVNFENSDDANAAVDDLNEKEVNGKVLYVGRAQKKYEREEELRRQYENAKMEKLAKYQGVNLYVKNLDDDFDDERLHQEFSVYGVITSAKIMRDERGDSKGFGFVCFSSPDEATKAVTEMNGRMIGSKPIYVALAQRKEVRRSQLDAQMNQRNQMQMQQNVPMAGGPGGPGGPYMGGAPMYYTPMNSFRPVYPPSGMMPRPRWAPQHGQPMPGFGGPQGNYPMQPRPMHGGAPPIPQPGRPQASTQHHDQQTTESKNTNTGNDNENTLTASSLASATPELQKQMLGERLYPLIHGREPEYSGKITGMLLEMENTELLSLLDDQEALDRKVKEAMDVLKAHLADDSKESA
ncbi:unnamed protein product [Absidia cylindrospora]